MSLRSEVIRIINEVLALAKKISGLPAAGTLDGTELVEVVKDGVNSKTTTQDIADLGGGGGSGTVESVTGDGVDNFDPDNPVISFPDLTQVLSVGNDAGGQQISNVADPTLDNDVDTKGARNAAIAALVDSSPSTLDTLNELAAALGDDPNFAATVATSIGLKVAKAGDTMSGNLAMGGNKVTGSGAASANGELVRYEQHILKQDIVNAATVLTDGASIDLTAIKHTLASSSATRTFTISYTGDDITIEVTLSNTAATYTFPATSLCTSEGIASGDNLLALAGVSGDKYIIAIKKIGSAYYVVCKNFGQ